MPGPWTVVEEWRGIDVLAVSAWSSVGKYARVGYEVKVSRSDLRRELLRPSKRASNVAWCNEFYLAVPVGLLRPDELAYEEPEWQPGDFARAPCRFAVGPERPDWNASPGPCYSGRREVKGPLLPGDRFAPRIKITCDGCAGKGYEALSRVEREAPKVWVPRDVGLVVVAGSCRAVKASPKRKEVPAVGPRELGQFTRWVSMRPDPRHAG